MHDDYSFLKMIGAPIVLEDCNELYGDTYAKQLRTTPGSCLLEKSNSIVVEACDEMSFLETDKVKRQGVIQDINRRQKQITPPDTHIDFPKDDSSRTIVLYARYEQGACPVATYLMKED